MHHSGPEDNFDLYGVTIAMNSRSQSILICWESVSPRLAMAWFTSTLFNVTVIAVYALTLQTELTVTDTFYNELQDLINRIPRRDILIAGLGTSYGTVTH